MYHNQFNGEIRTLNGKEDRHALGAKAHANKKTIVLVNQTQQQAEDPTSSLTSSERLSPKIGSVTQPNVSAFYAQTTDLTPSEYVENWGDFPAARFNTIVYGKKPQIVMNPATTDKGFISKKGSLKLCTKPAKFYRGLHLKIVNSVHWSPLETLSDVLVSSILKNPAVMRMYRQALLKDANLYSSMSSQNTIFRSSLDEFKKLGCLVGSAVFRGPFVEDPVVHREDVTTIEIERLDASIECMINDVRTIAVERHISVSRSVHAPRMTSNGSLLAGIKESIPYRTYCKSLLGLIGLKCMNAEDFAMVGSHFKSLFAQNGYSDVWNTFTTGRRRMHYAGIEPFTSIDLASVDEISILGYTKSAQFRIRNICMQQEAAKIYEKRYAEFMKDVLLRNHPSFNVDPSYVYEIQAEITRRSLRDHLFDDSQCYCFYDISNQDNSICETLQRGYYRVLKATTSWSDLDTERKMSANIASVTDAGATPSDYLLFPEGKVSNSGDAHITVENCDQHKVCHDYAASKALGISVAAYHEVVGLSMTTRSKWLFYALGDDGQMYLGPIVSVYLEYQRIFAEELGIKIAFESGFNFLKRTVSDGRVIFPSRLNICGSLTRTITGEYAKNDEVIARCGMLDRLIGIGGSKAPYVPEVFKVVCRLLDIDLSKDLIAQRRALDNELIAISKSSIEKARAVQSYLDHEWYTNGESLPDELLEAYGSLTYNVEEDVTGFGLVNLSLEELMSEALEVQKFQFHEKSSGDLNMDEIAEMRKRHWAIE